MSFARPVSEYLTRQFYEWELWGRGRLLNSRPVSLEPPFSPFVGHTLPAGIISDDGVKSTFLSQFAENVVSLFKTPTVVSPPPLLDERFPVFVRIPENLIEFQAAFGREDEPSIKLVEHVLGALVHCGEPLSFEIIASASTIRTQFSARSPDAAAVAQQLKAHFHEGVFTAKDSSLGELWVNSACRSRQFLEFGLDREFFVPLRVHDDLETDILISVCGAVDCLIGDELAVYQVLFEPVRHKWAESAWRALTTRSGDPFLEDFPESLRYAERKFQSPLYATIIRLGVKSDTEARSWELLKSLAGSLNLSSAPDGNRLVPLQPEDYAIEDQESDFLSRVTRRFGMLLNSKELVTFAHFPSSAVRSSRLERRLKQTKSAPEISAPGVTLGLNEHDGSVRPAVLSNAQRLRHLHVIGNSGTGKSTFLLNLICQDIYQGNGAAVLDPHGDLIDDILPFVPPERWNDVILFDAADDEYPIGFNILSAHSELEKTLLASDLVDVFRRLSTSWGDQMRSVLGNAILAFLESKRVGTLPELRRFLIEPGFRKEFLAGVSDPEVVYYWEHEFPLLKTHSLGPLLTRLDEFLRRKTIRYIVGQSENKLDFAKIMDSGQIFLARLPQGLIGEENSFMLGSLLLSKFQQISIARQEKEKSERRPYFLYLDEFHHFITPSLETILSGGRKYGLGLTLAHQSVHQLEKAGSTGNSVLSLAGSRISFRIGDADARKLSDGFASFEAADLQSLDNYEAICRIDRRENDFNLRTISPPGLDAAAEWRKKYLRYLSRLQYGTPRQNVEEQLAKARAVPQEKVTVDPFKARATKLKKSAPLAETANAASLAVPDIPIPVTKPPPPKTHASAPISAISTESRDENVREHEWMKREIGREAELLNHTVIFEKQVLDGKGRVDIVLEREGTAIACEVSVTTTIEHEVQNVQKCLRAGFSEIAVICSSKRRLSHIKSAVEKRLGDKSAGALGYYTPAGFIGILRERQQRESIPAKATPFMRHSIDLIGTDLKAADRHMREEEMLRQLSARMRKNSSQRK